jgi:enoyl-CoA hydratase
MTSTMNQVHPPLYVEKLSGIATLVINRPGKRNSFTREMWIHLTELIGAIEADQETKVLVLRSSDHRAFSAGADINEFRQLRGDRDKIDAYEQAAGRAEATLARCLKPTIAMISGFCVGGGCGLAVACDFRFADSTSAFGITPAKLGLVYSLVATKRLVDLVGPANAKLLLMSGELFGAERAQKIGLITELCETDQLEEKTYGFAQSVSSRAQQTVRGAKSIVGMILDGAVAETEQSRILRDRAYTSDDYREGVEAFLEGRAPRFT